MVELKFIIESNLAKNKICMASIKGNTNQYSIKLKNCDFSWIKIKSKLAQIKLINEN